MPADLDSILSVAGALCIGGIVAALLVWLRGGKKPVKPKVDTETPTRILHEGTAEVVKAADAQAKKEQGTVDTALHGDTPAKDLAAIGKGRG
jgi:hypothetical protein